MVGLSHGVVVAVVVVVVIVVRAADGLAQSRVTSKERRVVLLAGGGREDGKVVSKVCRQWLLLLSKGRHVVVAGVQLRVERRVGWAARERLGLLGIQEAAGTGIEVCVVWRTSKGLARRGIQFNAETNV